MININLIPKQYLKRSGGVSLGKHGVYAAAAVCGIILMLGAVTVYQLHQMKELGGQMEIARSRTAQLEKDIKMVDALIDIKAKITNRMDAVERLDRHRGAWVRILEDLTRNIPEFVWLSSFTEISEKPVAVAIPRPGQATKSAPQPKVDTATVVSMPTGPIVRPAEIEGFTFTLNALASFMIKMMRSNFFEDVDLVYSKEIAFGKQKAYNFKLSCNVHYLSDEELERLVAQETDNNLEITN
jgi:Tfp pilus assembly protein PilN